MRKASLVSSDFVGSMTIVTSGSRKVGSVLKEDYRSHSASMLLPYVVCMYSVVGGLFLIRGDCYHECIEYLRKDDDEVSFV